jgi:hypothetical protein
MNMRQYCGEVIINWTKAKATVEPLPNGRYSLKFSDSNTEYICNAEDFEPAQQSLINGRDPRRI